MNFTAAIINLIDHLHGFKAHLLTVSKINLEKTILVLPSSTILNADLLLNHNRFSTVPATFKSILVGIGTNKLSKAFIHPFLREQLPL
jgi:hypothetical protein